jgi:hypothetical protein
MSKYYIKGCITCIYAKPSCFLGDISTNQYCEIKDKSFPNFTFSAQNNEGSIGITPSVCDQYKSTYEKQTKT